MVLAPRVVGLVVLVICHLCRKVENKDVCCCIHPAVLCIHPPTIMVVFKNLFLCSKTLTIKSRIVLSIWQAQAKLHTESIWAWILSYVGAKDFEKSYCVPLWFTAFPLLIEWNILKVRKCM